MSIGDSFDLEAFLRFRTEGVDEAADDVRDVGDAADEAGSKVESSLGEKLTGLGESAKSAGAALSVGLTASLGALGVSSIQAASDAEEAQSRFENVFSETGDQVEAFADRFADEIGRSQLEIEKTAANFGSLLAPMIDNEEQVANLSTEFTELTQDLASFENRDPAQVQRDLQSALAGQSETVRKYGVDLSQARLEQMGLTEESTRAEEAQLRLQAIIEDTQSAQGNAADTSESFANQQRALRASFKDLRVEIGEQLLPIAKDLVDIVKPAIGTFGELSDSQQRAVIAVGALAAALGPVVLIAGQLAIAAGALAGVVSGPLLVGIIAAVAAGAGLLALFGDDLLPVFEDLAAFVMDEVIPPLVEFGEDVLEGTIMPAVEDAADEFEPLIDEAEALADEFEKTADFILREVVPVFVAELAPAAESLGDVFDDVFGLIATVVSNAMDIAFDAIEVLLALFRGDFDTALNAAGDLVDTIAQSIEENFDALSDAVVSTVNLLVDTIVGTFRSLYRVLLGSSIVPDIVNGVESAFKALRQFFASVWNLAPLTSTFEGAKRQVGRVTSRLRSGVESTLDGLRSWLSGVWNLHPLSDTFEAVVATVMGGEESAGIIPTLRRDVQDALNRLRSWIAGVWDLNPLSGAFEAVADRLFGDGGIVSGIVSDVKGGLRRLVGFIEETFGVDIEQAFRDAFNAAVSAIGDAFDRLSFGSFENALDEVAGGVRSLIDSLNELSGVNINVDVPSFDSLLDRAKDLVEPEPQPQPQPPDDDDDDDDNPGDPDDRNESGGDTGVDGERGKSPDDVLDEPDDDGPGGPVSDPDPGDGTPGAVATGGFIEADGMAMLHEGERVLPDSQITDRGEAEIAGSGVTIGQLTVNASGRAEGRAAGRALKRELKRFDI